MIRSMTGFGDAAKEVDGVHYSVEIRSLNNRYFKSSIRLPEVLGSLEAELESVLRQKLNRGSVTLLIGVRDNSALAAYEINSEALSYYLKELKRIKQGLDDDSFDIEIDPSTLLSLPGVMQPHQGSDMIDRDRPVIHDLLETACEKLTQMRVKEGAGIAKALREYCATIAERLEYILGRAPMVIEEYHQRLQTRVEHLIAKSELKVAEVDLVREIAIYAERCDIAEEAQRLKAHLKQVDTILSKDDGEPAGRTLDFLSQELLREANTIASKSNDADINRMVVEIKGAIDRIKEQVQNIE